MGDSSLHSKVILGEPELTARVREARGTVLSFSSLVCIHCHRYSYMLLTYKIGLRLALYNSVLFVHVSVQKVSQPAISPAAASIGCHNRVRLFRLPPKHAMITRAM